MATIYVNKSGVDTNNGTTAALAKLTLAAALTAAATGDTIIVGAGQYNETLTWTSVKSITWQADGRVIIDGQNTRNYCFDIASNNVSLTWKGFQFRNAVQAIFNNSNGIGTFTFQDCELTDSPRGCSNPTAQLTLNRCLVRDFTGSGAGVSVLSCSSGTVVLTDNTFDNIVCPNGVFERTSNGTSADQFLRNVYSKCSVFYYQSGVTGQNGYWDYNFYDVPFGGVWKITTTTYTSLSTWKTARNTNPAYDLNSSSGTPDFTDRTKRLFGPLPAGNLFIGPAGSAVGFSSGRPAYALSNNRNSGSWTTAALSNLMLNASGNLQLTAAGSGTATFPTIDLGAVVRLRGLRVGDLGETMPTDVIDSTNTDVRPNYATIEYRTSLVSQADCEAQAWSTVQRWTGAQVVFPVVNARWIQVRVTLRSDGVAACKAGEEA